MVTLQTSWHTNQEEISLYIKNRYAGKGKNVLLTYALSNITTLCKLSSPYYLFHLFKNENDSCDRMRCRYYPLVRHVGSGLT